MSILKELNNYINAGRNIISIQCQLPERVRIIESICLNIQMSRHIPCYLWNLGQGSFHFIPSKHENSGESNPSPIYPLASAFPDELNSQITSPLDVISQVAKCSSDCFFILEDLHSFLQESGADMQSRITAQFLRSQLINLAFAWADTRKYAILLGTQETELPPILSSIIPEFWNPLPHYQENVALLSELLPQMGLSQDSLSRDSLTADSLTTNSLTTDNLTPDDLSINSLSPDNLSYDNLSPNNLIPNNLTTDNLTTDNLTTNNISPDIPQLALAAGGLSPEEIRSGLRLVKAQQKPLIQGLLDFKIQRLKAFNLSFTPRPNVSNFGGMDRIRAGINGIKKDYSNEARSHGIPLPKGWLLVGPPGTGKTFVSKFCASILEFPMIAVDTGAIASGGASYLRRLIDRIEASAPAVVYFDELDKLFPESGQPADITQRQVLGLLLTWLQDKVSQTFVIATLNRLDSLPPELTRLGRFDEIFYVGFPQNGERKDILHLHLARFDERYKNGNSPMSDKDWRVIINQTVNFTGAELSILVEKAAKKLFHELKRIEINLEELLATRREITPLFMRDTDRILRIENIAKGVASPCSSPDSSIYAPPLTTLWGKKNEQY